MIGSNGRFMSKNGTNNGRVDVICSKCGKSFWKFYSRLVKNNYCNKDCYFDSMSGREVWNKGIPRSKELKEKLRIINTGKKASEETRRKMSLKHMGEKSPGWKGGITPKIKLARVSLNLCLWREKVYKRDNYTCVSCGENKRYLNAHHLSSFSSFPEVRYEVDNGATLCRDCHKRFHDVYGKTGKTTPEQFIVFINL